MFNILIAEDDRNIQTLTKIKLTDEGYNVSIASDGQECLDLIKEKPFDLIIMDIMMPKVNGLEAVKHIRETGNNIPIIIVSAKSDFPDKALAFDLEVDDYMVKPINFSELNYRIKALMRRAQIVSERKIHFKDCVIDYDSLSVTRISTGESVVLTKKEFSILFRLLSFPERVFTKNEIFTEFWGFNSESEDNTVKVHINQIRNKTKNFTEFSIVNIRGIGYKGIKNE